MKRHINGTTATCAVLATLLTMALSERAVAQSDVPPPETLTDTQYIHSLRSASSSSSGIFVAEPVPVHVDANTIDFGVGCSAWLEYALGSQGQLGQSPTYSDIEQDRNQVQKKPNMRLLPSEAKAVAGELGLTHIVTATVSGSASSCHLIYTIRKRDGSPLGQPISLAGTEDQIIAALPKTASAILSAIAKLGHEPIPGLGGLTPADMELIGRSKRDYTKPLSAADSQSWWALAVKSPLGGLSIMADHPSETKAADRLLQQAGNNPLILAAIADIQKPPTNALTQAIVAAMKVFPQSYAVVSAQYVNDNTHNATAKDFALRRTQAEKCVRLAPNNPQAWIILAGALRDQANGVRNDHPMSLLTDAQQAYVTSLVPLWQAAAQQAATLSPHSGSAWTELANAAMFNTESDTADRAATEAIKYSPQDDNAYWVAMEMYQPKWYSNPDKLLSVCLAEIANRGIDQSYDKVKSLMSLLPEKNPKTILLKKQMRQYILDHGLNAATRPLWDEAQAHPNAVDKWLVLWNKMEDEVEQTRQSRARQGMNDTEQTYVKCLRPLCFEVAQHIVELDPKSINNWLMLAKNSIFNSTEGLAPLRQSLAKALALDPANLQAYDIGLEYYQPKWTVDGFADLIDIATQAEAHPDIFSKEAAHIVMAMQAGKHSYATKEQVDRMQALQDKAKKEVDSVGSTDTSDPSLLSELAGYEDFTGNRDKAIEICKKWEKSAPDDSAPAASMASLLQSKGDADGAISAYQTAVRLAPSNGELLSNLLALQLSQYQDADIEPMARQLTLLAPLRSFGYYALGRSLIAKRKYAEAIPVLQKAYKLDPKNIDRGIEAQILIPACQTADAKQQGIVAAWRQTKAFAKDIAVGSGGAIWIAATDDQAGKIKSIYRWSGSKWDKVPGEADRIAVDPNGYPWIVASSAHNIKRWDDGYFVTVPGWATDIGTGPDGSIWAISNEPAGGGFEILHWGKYNFSTIEGSGTRIAVDTYGQPWITNKFNDSFDKTDGNWHNHNGITIDVGAGLDGSIWAVQTPGGTNARNLLHWTGYGWDVFPGQGVAISVGPDGLPWLVCADGSIQAGPQL